VRGGLVGQRGDVQAAQCYEYAASAVGVRQFVGAAGRGDVHLDHHEVRAVVVEP
jgi:hypothetical protein